MVGIDDEEIMKVRFTASATLIKNQMLQGRMLSDVEEKGISAVVNLCDWLLGSAPQHVAEAFQHMIRQANEMIEDPTGKEAFDAMKKMLVKKTYVKIDPSAYAEMILKDEGVDFVGDEKE